MADRLTEYKILIYGPDCEHLGEVRHCLLDVTWEAGHYARPLRSEPGLPGVMLAEVSIAAAQMFWLCSPGVRERTSEWPASAR
jgi:hypothetical protein